MTWNNRIIKHTEKIKGKKYFYFAIHEVFYNEKGKIEAWTKDAMTLLAETPKELKETMRFRMEAFNAPILKLVSKNGKDKLVKMK